MLAHQPSARGGDATAPDDVAGSTATGQRSVASGPSPGLPRHRSVTHLHVLACLNSLIGDRIASATQPVRVLDVGCGDGRLMAYLHRALAVLHPGQPVEVYGFEVSEQGWGVVDERLRAFRHLDASCPGVAWQDRLRLVSARDPWPFPDGFFDAAVSNVVLEHVADADLFFASLRRVLKDEGVSVHVAPLAHCVYEGHVHVPFAHWIGDFELQRAWIALANRCGIGRWRSDRVIFDEPDLRRYAERQAAYLNVNTHYRSFATFQSICRRHDLAVSHRFTADFYLAKLRDLRRASPRLSYRREPRLVLDALSFLVLRYASASTLVVAPVRYDVAGRIHAERHSRQGEADD
jgi:SAM-dependent methyltransferase